ncbi:MAG: DUF4105 domain-containing protein, partial [Halobacteriovoraceae bacterium]|nr:DUF4105 domain-containing protein [Halobacteriovoraceae bacterium]
MKKLLFFLILPCLAGGLFASEVRPLDRLLFTESHRQIQKSNQKFFSRLEKRFLAGKIIGLEILIAQASSRRVESRFGHALLRFVDSVPGSGNDIVLGFVADVPSQKLSYLRGLFGGYGLYPVLKGLRSFTRDYLKNEERPLERIILPSSLIQRAKLFAILKDWWGQYQAVEKENYQTALVLTQKAAKKRARKLFGKDNFSLLPLLDPEQRVLGIAIGEGPELKRQQFFQQALRRAQTAANAWGEGRNSVTLQFKSQLIGLPWRQNFQRSSKLSELRVLAHARWGDDSAIFPILSEDQGPQEYLALPFDRDKTWQQQYMKSRHFEIRPLIETLSVKSLKIRAVGSYTFLNRNCSKALINFLKTAKYPVKKWVGIGGRVPVRLIKYLRKSLVAPYPVTTIDASLLLKNKMRKILGRQKLLP